MIKSTYGSITVLTFDRLASFPEIRHFVSTRLGGCSSPPFESLNIAFHTADELAHVLQNRQRLLAHLGIPLEYLTTAKQVHGNDVAVVTSDMRGSGACDYDSAIEATDALITNVPNTCLMVQVADCPPILLYDPGRQVIAAVHAGWRGSAQLITLKTVRTMVDHFDCQPKDIVACIGPSIGPCCYEVGPEVVYTVRETMGSLDGLAEPSTSSDRFHLDLWEANRRQLIEAGIREHNIEVAQICTRCKSALFFSERSCRGTGRFGAGIMLTEQ
ncbi:MAG: peptidoglycan editing factor PgeF [Armatimonadetes bacterium]|nr:peptidoglycan editing factor PgeF [Armatimonadota bacterium]